MNYFSADLHLGHSNILRYSNRPFRNVQEMDDVLIDNINETVKSTDTFWFLGDFCFGPREPSKFFKVAENYRKRINCQNIVLIWGNHDPKLHNHNKEKKKLAEDFRYLFCDDYKIIDTTINDKKITLCHYAMLVWDKSHHGAWHLYGHSHGSLPDNPNSLSIDVGVDARAMRHTKSPKDYRPFSFVEIETIMSKKTFVPIDHHGK